MKKKRIDKRYAISLKCCDGQVWSQDLKISQRCRHLYHDSRYPECKRFMRRCISTLACALLVLVAAARAGDPLGPPPWSKDNPDKGDQRPPPWMPDDPGGNKFGVDPMQLLQS